MLGNHVFTVFGFNEDYKKEIIDAASLILLNYLCGKRIQLPYN